MGKIEVKTVYISIPMKGLDLHRQRMLANEIAIVLKSKGYLVINPFEVCETVDKDLSDTHHYAECMGKDIHDIILYPCGNTFKSGEIGNIIHVIGDGKHYDVYFAGVGTLIEGVSLQNITDEFPVRITHYECIKDGKVILSSNEPIEAESIDDFKANAKRLIQCDTVNVEFENIGE